MQINSTPEQIVAPHPEPEKQNNPIFPLFMPYAGCISRCIFCSQERQTGTEAMANRGQLDQLLQSLDQAMEQRKIAGQPPVELAFFGGTFTATPPKWQATCLERAAYWKDQGQVCAVRCSTRPDAINPALLDSLQKKGVSTIELGIQSFADNALLASRRGYTAATASRACSMARESGLTLGIQLMPGLPGQDIHTAREDIFLAAEAKPAFVRLYPCLVFTGTALEKLWRQGGFTPMETSDTITFLGESCLHFWQRGIAVIRMGIAPEASALRAIAAGPFHPAMGARARALALFLYLQEKIREYQASTGRQAAFWSLRGPRRYQGEFWGHRGELKKNYEAMGIGAAGSIIWEKRADFILRPA